MKRLHLFISLVAIVCFVCSCGEEKPTIAIFDLVDGDTIKVQHELSESEIETIFIKDYKYEDEYLTLNVTNEEFIPTDFELMGFLSYSDVDKKNLQDFKEQMVSIEKPVESQVYTYKDNVKNNTYIYIVDKSFPQSSFGVCLRNEAYNKYYETFKEEMPDFNDAQLQYTITMFCIASNLVNVYTAYSFKTESGIITRLLLFAQHK